MNPQQPPSTLDAYLQQYAPTMIGHSPVVSGPFHDVPLLGSKTGAMGQINSGFLQGQAVRQMHAFGMMPAGFGHDQNLFDIIRRQQFAEFQSKAMAEAAELDRENYVKTFKGLAAMTGTPFGARQRRAADTLASGMIQFAPMLAKANPDLLDQLAGPTGSAAAMAVQMMPLTKFRIDPVTGRMGLSGESIGAYASDIRNNMFSNDSMRYTYGMTMGQTGGLFREMQMRGLVDHMRPAPMLQGLSAMSGFGQDALSNDPSIGKALRQFDAVRVRKSIEKYTEAIGTMKEIFGERGEPNAPMAKLVQALDAMTSGGLGRMDPGRMAELVRKTKNLANMGGMSLDTVMALQGHAAQQGAAMGISPSLAIGATQGTLAFGAAYRGLGYGAIADAGGMNSDQMQQLDLNLRMRAAGSPLANRIAVIRRLERAGGGFAANTDAARLISRLDSGDLSITEEEAIAALSSSKNRRGFAALQGGATTFRDMLSQRAANDATIEEQNIGGAVRDAMVERDVVPILQDALGSRAASELKDVKFLNDKARRTLSGRIAAAATEAMTKGGINISDPAKRREIVGAAIRKAVVASLGPQMDRIMGADFDYGQLGENLYQQGGEELKSQRMPFENIGDLAKQFSPELRREREKVEMEAAYQGRLQKAFGGLGQGTLLQRVVGAVQNTDIRDPNAVLKVVGAALGGVDHKSINRAIVDPLIELERTRTQLEKMQSQMAAEVDPTRRTEMQKRIDMQLDLVTKQTQDLRAIGDKYGLVRGDTGKLIAEASGGLRSVMANVRQLAPIRGAYEASDEDVKKFLMSGEAKAMLADPAISQELAASRMKYRLEQIAGGKDWSPDLGEYYKGLYNATTGGKVDSAAALDRSFATRMLEVAMNPGKDPDAYAKMLAFTQTSPGKLGHAAPLPGQIDETFMRDLPAEARLLLRRSRGRLANRPTKEEIDAFVMPGASRDEIESFLSARNQAARTGLALGLADPANAKELRERIAQYETQFRNAEDQIFAISPADIEAMKNDSGFKAMYPQGFQDAAVAKYRKDRGMWKASDAEVRDAMMRQTIMQKRFGDRNIALGEYAKTGDWAIMRDANERTQDAVNDISTQLASDPAAMQQYGLQGLEAARELQAGRQMLKTFAKRYAGNDVAALIHGMRITDGSAADVGQIKIVDATVRSILANEQAILGGLGRKTLDGDVEKVREAMGMLQPGLSLDAIRANAISPEQAARRAELEAGMGRRLRQALGNPNLDLELNREAKNDYLAMFHGVASDEYLRATVPMYANMTDAQKAVVRQSSREALVNKRLLGGANLSADERAVLEAGLGLGTRKGLDRLVGYNDIVDGDYRGEARRLAARSEADFIRRRDGSGAFAGIYGDARFAELRHGLGLMGKLGGDAMAAYTLLTDRPATSAEELAAKNAALKAFRETNGLSESDTRAIDRASRMRTDAVKGAASRILPGAQETIGNLAKAFRFGAFSAEDRRLLERRFGSHDAQFGASWLVEQRGVLDGLGLGGNRSLDDIRSDFGKMNDASSDPEARAMLLQKYGIGENDNVGLQRMGVALSAFEGFSAKAMTDPNEFVKALSPLAAEGGTKDASGRAMELSGTLRIVDDRGNARLTGVGQPGRGSVNVPNP